MSPHFQILQKYPNGRGRLGVLSTAHGAFETPAFIFCATKASLKGLNVHQIQEAGTSIILSNTYHLMIQPGADLIHAQGGLHRFMGWGGPLLTDSGGFQIFSLGHGSVACEIKGTRQKGARSLVKLTEEGAIFRSYRNGDSYQLTPEGSIHIQRQLGADLILVLDECTPFHVEKAYTEQSMYLSHRWARRSLDAFEHSECAHPQGLYGIIQGGVYPELRQLSASFVGELPFFGQAIGGSLGATKDQMEAVIETTVIHTHPNRPLHLLGIGGVRDILTGVAQGIDTFDCVHPTRLARHGGALIQPHVWSTLPQDPRVGQEHINLNKSIFRTDNRPIDATCPCQTCCTYSRAYLHHLLKAREILAFCALTLHNVVFMNRLLAAIRLGLKNLTLKDVKKDWLLS